MERLLIILMFNVISMILSNKLFMKLFHNNPNDI